MFKLGVPQCSQNFFNTACEEHSWAVWCWHPLFARASTLAIVKEVQKITRLRGTVYICGRQSGGSMVAVLSSAARMIAGRESVMGGRWEWVEVEGGWKGLVLSPKSITGKLRFGVFS